MSESALLDRASEAPPAAAVPDGPLADLILVRLLPRTKVPPAAAKVRADVRPFFATPPADEPFAAVLADLRAAGLVTAKGQTLTDAGRVRALRYLGVSDVPPRANWGTLKSKFLLPKALGVTAAAVKDGRKLAAILLKRKLGLPVGTGDTLAAVLEAVACRELDFAGYTQLKDLKPALLARAIGSREPIDAKAVAAVVPRVLLGTTKRGKAGYQELALTGLTNAPAPAPVGDFDLEAFANTVRAAARDCPTGRFGGNKVFIGHVWRRLQHDRPFDALGLDGFKAKLVAANAADLLTLSRADLVQVMDPADVRESETGHLNATFHFILLEPE